MFIARYQNKPKGPLRRLLPVREKEAKVIKKTNQKQTRIYHGDF
jgi:hypothetical protein